ncbi:hypothetical protein RUM44_006676 [Polyplax serrata]|uniref:Uncharacterized protein n=1 Tax=Polyplax serrata TaxID=468196 RepID=A0ABR1AJH7_POLSC
MVARGYHRYPSFNVTCSYVPSRSRVVTLRRCEISRELHLVMDGINRYTKIDLYLKSVGHGMRSPFRRFIKTSGVDPRASGDPSTYPGTTTVAIWNTWKSSHGTNHPLNPMRFRPPVPPPSLVGAVSHARENRWPKKRISMTVSRVPLEVRSAGNRCSFGRSDLGQKRSPRGDRTNYN